MQSAQVFLFSIFKTSKINQTRGIVAQKALPWVSFWKFTKFLSPKNKSHRQGVTAPILWQVPPVTTGGEREYPNLKDITTEERQMNTLPKVYVENMNQIYRNDSGILLIKYLNCQTSQNHLVV